MTDALAATGDTPFPSATSRGSDERAESPEYVNLSAPEQHSLHTSLYKAYAAAPVETGAVDQVLAAAACAPVPCSFLRRAELLGLSRSVWAEVSQRSVEAIEQFLRSEERPDDPGASSSA